MKKISYLFVIIAGSMWGSIGFFSKLISLRGFSSIEICFLRSIFCIVILGIFFLFTNKKVFLLEKITDLKYFLGTGIVSFSLYNWSYIMAIKETSLGVAAILLYTAPAIIMLLSSVLFKEKITKSKFIALITTLIGCMLVTGLLEENSFISQKGFFYGILSGIGYALYSIFGKYALKKYSPVTVVFYTFFMSAIFFAFISNPYITLIKIKESNSWFLIATFALFTSAVPYVLYTKGLSKIEATKASILATVEPVVATIIGVIFFSEKISFLKILGIIFVIFSILILNNVFSSKTRE